MFGCGSGCAGGRFGSGVGSWDGGYGDARDLGDSRQIRSEIRSRRGARASGRGRGCPSLPPPLPPPLGAFLRWGCAGARGGRGGGGGARAGGARGVRGGGGGSDGCRPPWQLVRPVRTEPLGDGARRWRRPYLREYPPCDPAAPPPSPPPCPHPCPPHRIRPWRDSRPRGEAMASAAATALLPHVLSIGSAAELAERLGVIRYEAELAVHAHDRPSRTRRQILALPKEGGGVEHPRPRALQQRFPDRIRRWRRRRTSPDTTPLPPLRDESPPCLTSPLAARGASTGRGWGGGDRGRSVPRSSLSEILSEMSVRYWTPSAEKASAKPS